MGQLIWLNILFITTTPLKNTANRGKNSYIIEKMKSTCLNGEDLWRKSYRFNILKYPCLQFFLLLIIRIFEMLVVTNRRCRIDCRCGTTFPWRIILVQLWFFCTMTVRKKLDRCDVYLMTLGEKTVAEERECSKEE